MNYDKLKEIEARASLCAEATLPGEQLRALVAAALHPFVWCSNCKKATEHDRRGVDLCCSDCHFIAICYHDRPDAALSAQEGK